MTLLHKLVRVCGVCALFKSRVLSLESFQNFFENNFDFLPFTQEYDDLSWEEVYDILFDGESKEWFDIIEYDDEEDDIGLYIEIPKFNFPSTPYKHELDLLSKTSSLQLSAAFLEMGKMSVKTVLPLLNSLILDKKKSSLPVPSSLNVTSTNTSNNGDVIIVNTGTIAQQFLSDISKYKTKEIGLDCEGINLGINGTLTLVQISANGTQYLFDMAVKHAEHKQAIVNVVKKVLGDESILKIIHDCRNDLCGLYKSFQIVASSIIDTSIMYQVINNNSQNIGINNLCKMYNVAGNEYKTKGEKLHKSGGWGNRPLTKLMIDYASGDVRTLVQLYRAMVSSVKNETQLLSQVDNRVKMLWKDVCELLKVPIPKSINQKETSLRESISQKDVAQKEEKQILNHVDCSTTIINQIYSFLDLFPKTVQEKISNIAGADINNLIEVAMDKGRPYELFYYHKKESYSNTSFIVQKEDIDEITNKLEFGSDNRAGIDGSLHRISSLPNRNSQIIGLTLRVGRAVMGRSKIFSDLIEQGKSVLLLGKPGSGKTTIIRDFAKNLAETRRVVVVDTSCEIGGFGDVPHIAIGKARRMQVSDIRKQQEVMIQAVQNHTPEVIVIDEIGTKDETTTARTIAQRGVILVGSAHGDMKSILKNPILCELLGGVESVIMGDRSASSDGEKMKLQLKADPVFDVVIQLPDDTTCNEWKIFTDLRQTVQNILAKRPFQVEVRKLVGNKITSSQLSVE